MLRRFCTGSIVPVIDFDAAVLETLGLEVRHVFGVERRKTVITRRAMEKHHVAQDTLSSQHLAQKFLTERCVDLSSSNRDVVSPASNNGRRKLSEVGLMCLFLAHGPFKRTKCTLVVNSCTFPIRCSLKVH